MATDRARFAQRYLAMPHRGDLTERMDRVDLMRSPCSIVPITVLNGQPGRGPPTDAGKGPRPDLQFAID